MAPWGIAVREIGRFSSKLTAIKQSENVERLTNVSIEFSTRTGTISTILLERNFCEQFGFMKSSSLRFYLTAKWKSVFDVSSKKMGSFLLVLVWWSENV